MKTSNILLALVLAVGFALPASAQVNGDALDSERQQDMFQSRRD